jgi:hypothetical protein
LAFPQHAEMSITVRRSEFLRERCGSSHTLDEKASGVIAGLDPAIHLLVKVDGYAGQARV